MIIYYLGIMFINNLVDTHPQYHLSDEIKSGVFSNYLTKPFSITVKKIADAISWRIVRIIFLAPIFLIFFLLFKSYWENYSLNFVNILSFMISLFFAFFLNFFIKMSLGLSSVWFLESGWLFFFYQILASFFSGELIPLDLFPSTFLKLVNLLPFKYMLFFPLSLEVPFLNLINNYKNRKKYKFSKLAIFRRGNILIYFLKLRYFFLRLAIKSLLPSKKNLTSLKLYV